MKLDRSQIPTEITTVEQAIIYLSLVLDEGDVNSFKLKSTEYVEEKNRFKLKSESSNLGLWHRVEEFRDIEFKPIGMSHSVGFEVNPVPVIVPRRIEIGSILCVNTAIEPRFGTVLHLTIECNFPDTEVVLETNSSYVWDRFDFTTASLMNIENLTLNADRSQVRFKTKENICQIALPSVDTTDTQNFSFPVFIKLPNGKTVKGKDLLIISVTNQYPVEYRPDLTRFNIGGREWILDFNIEYQCYQLQSTCINQFEFNRLSTPEYANKLKAKIEATIGKPVKLLVTWFSNPSKMYSRAGYENTKSIQYLFQDLI